MVEFLAVEVLQLAYHVQVVDFQEALAQVVVIIARVRVAVRAVAIHPLVVVRVAVILLHVVAHVQVVAIHRLVAIHARIIRIVTQALVRVHRAHDIIIVV